MKIKFEILTLRGRCSKGSKKYNKSFLDVIFYYLCYTTFSIFRFLVTFNDDVTQSLFASKSNVQLESEEKTIQKPDRCTAQPFESFFCNSIFFQFSGNLKSCVVFCRLWIVFNASVGLGHMSCRGVKFVEHFRFVTVPT